MPVIRRRSCSQCGATIHPDARCRCGTAHGNARRKSRGYNLKAWATLRQQAIAAHPWCALCRSERNLTVDHLVYPARSVG